MAVNLHIPSERDIHPVPGIEIGIAAAGIRKADHNDLTVFRLSENSKVAESSRATATALSGACVRDTPVKRARHSCAGHQHRQCQRRNG